MKSARTRGNAVATAEAAYTTGAADAFQKTVGRVAGTAITKPRPWEAETLAQLKELLSEADQAMDAFVTEAHLAVRPRSNKSDGGWNWGFSLRKLLPRQRR